MMIGMSDNVGGEAFSDDEFPDIPNDELLRLEQDAITFTQQERPVTRPQTATARHNPQLNAHKTRSKAPNVSAQHVLHNASGRHEMYRDGDRHQIQQTSSEGTVFDEDGLSLIVEEQPQIRPRAHLDETTLREQWRLSRFAQPHGQALAQPPHHMGPVRTDNYSVLQHKADHISGRFHPAELEHEVGRSALYKNVGEEALRVQVAALIRERDELTNNLSKAKEEVFARKGEVANIRAKQSDDQKMHERQLSALQKLKEEENKKHAVTVQAANAENAKITSEVQFLRQELKEESRKAQVYQRQMKERPLTDRPTNLNTTPKRNHSLRDGFDDDEMALVSPVRSGKKSRQGTPTANRKRKQPNGYEAQIQPLALRLSGATTGPPNHFETEAESSKTNAVEPVFRKDRMTERHLRLLQKITSFRPSGGQGVLVERLFKMSYPSDSAKTIGFALLNELARLEGQRLPGDLTQVFIDLWSRALKEQYYICLQPLLEAISYILDQDPFVVDAALLKSILPVLQSTVEINATARFKLTRKDQLSNSAHPKPMIEPRIDNTHCLELLHTMSCLVMDDRKLIELFWGSISTDFVLMMLNACQPIPDITLMLQTLATSILPDTFGMICPASEQNRFETYICDRFCYLLWEIPKPELGKPPYSSQQICHLRQESLNLLTKLTLGTSPNPFNPATADNHGTRFLANHPTAIARLVRCVYDELAVAYTMPSSQPQHVKLVNSAVRILHFVLFSPEGRRVSWQSKITGINGGAYKFRVAMARLTYADGTTPGIDAGVTDDTMRMATELLEEIVTPDEVDDLVRVFEGEGTGTHRRSSAVGSTQR